MSDAPAASSISAAVAAMSFIIASSLSLHVMWMRSTGMPNASTVAGRIDLDEVLEPRERFAEAAEIEIPLRLPDGLSCRPLRSQARPS